MASSIVDPTQLSFLSVNGQMVPPEGPRAIPLLLDFSQATQFSLNLQNLQQRNFFTMLQSMFLDNSANGAQLVVNFPNTGQNLIIAPNHQAYKSCLCPNPAQMTFTSQGGVLVPIFMLNYPVSQNDWPVITGA